MLRSGLIFTLMIAVRLCICAQTFSDMGMARDWCDRTMLRRVEGIWEFPEDQTRVLVKRTPGSENDYEIVVIETPDTRLKPGDKIGTITASPLPTKFDMTLYRDKKAGIFGNPGRCYAELNESADALLITTRKIKFSLASRWFLPSFWRAVKVSTSNPSDKLPKGMIRIYPADSSQQPDYL